MFIWLDCILVAWVVGFIGHQGTGTSRERPSGKSLVSSLPMVRVLRSYLSAYGQANASELIMEWWIASLSDEHCPLMSSPVGVSAFPLKIGLFFTYKIQYETGIRSPNR